MHIYINQCYVVDEDEPEAGPIPPEDRRQGGVDGAGDEEEAGPSVPRAIASMKEWVIADGRGLSVQKRQILTCNEEVIMVKDKGFVLSEKEEEELLQAIKRFEAAKEGRNKRKENA